MRFKSFYTVFWNERFFGCLTHSCATISTVKCIVNLTFYGSCKVTQVCRLGLRLLSESIGVVEKWKFGTKLF